MELIDVVMPSGHILTNVPATITKQDVQKLVPPDHVAWEPSGPYGPSPQPDPSKDWT